MPLYGTDLQEYLREKKQREEEDRVQEERMDDSDDSEDGLCHVIVVVACFLFYLSFKHNKIAISFSSRRVAKGIIVVSNHDDPHSNCVVEDEAYVRYRNCCCGQARPYGHHECQAEEHILQAVQHTHVPLH